MMTSPNVRATPTTPRLPPYSASAITAPHPANTRVNAASPSANARRGRSGAIVSGRAGQQLAQKSAYPLRDLVADPPHRLQILARRVLQFPVLVALSGVDRACVAATHGDHDVRLAHGAVLEELRPLAREVDAEFLHRVHRHGVDALSRLAPGRAHVHPVVAQCRRQRRRHLTAPGVVDAYEEDRWPAGRCFTHGRHLPPRLSIDTCQ